jgi:hypothetical protein
MLYSYDWTVFSGVLILGFHFPTLYCMQSNGSDVELDDRSLRPVAQCCCILMAITQLKACCGSC